MKIIYVKSKNHGIIECLVDDDDYDYLMTWKWYVYKAKRTFYIIGRHNDIGRKSLFMHRVIMNVTDPDLEVDHKDHNGLNNQKENLRSCEFQLNRKNKSPNCKNKTSKYLGVCRFKNSDKWVAQIYFNKEQIMVGRFDNEEEAARAYDAKARQLRGEWANLNFA